MREIFFSGKRKDNNEWVYGYLIIRNGNPCIWYETIDEFTQCGSWYEFVEVIPETVGQFTGLTDKNGTKIFEGAILRLGTGEIRYVFYAAPRFKHTMYNEYAREFSYKDKEYEVIGNIHDNPELLGVREK